MSSTSEELASQAVELQKRIAFFRIEESAGLVRKSSGKKVTIPGQTAATAPTAGASG